MPGLPPDSLVAITGITGYIGSHVGLATLQAGHRVRGIVRSMDRAHALREAYAKAGIDVGPDRVDFVVVSDLADQALFEKAFKGVIGVAHVAIDIGGQGDMVDGYVDSTLAVMRAAAGEPSVKRVVLTSSAIAANSSTRDPSTPLTVAEWNDEAIRQYNGFSAEEKKSPMNMMVVYASAKTLAEQAAWRFIEQERPGYELSTIITYSNFGPVLHGEPRTTALWIYGLLKNDASCTHFIAGQWYVDVRDTARLHTLALTVPSLGGKRIMAAAGPCGWNDILDILRANFPHVELPGHVEGKQGERSTLQIDSEVARESLGGWISLEKCLVDTGRSLGV